MNEVVLVGFKFFTDDTTQRGLAMLNALGEDFNELSISTIVTGINLDETHIVGKISSSALTVIRLSHPDLTECMNISYVSDDLKNKYRTLV